MSIYPIEINIGDKVMDLDKATKSELISKINERRTKEKFFENVSNIAYFSTDEDRVVQEWNSSCEDLYGYKKDKAIGRKIEELIIPNFQKKSFLTEFGQKNSIYGEELEYIKADGTMLGVYVNALFLDNNYFHIGLKPSRIKQTNSIKALVGDNISNNSKLVIISFDKNGYINDFNPFAEQLLGYKKEEVIGRNFVELFVLQSYKEKTLTQINQSFKSKSPRLKNDLPLLCKNGSKKIIHWKQSFVSNHKISSMLLVGDDGAFDNSVQDHLEYLANYDTLTELPNLNLLSNRMVKAINKAARNHQKMITMYINLDNFKSINHTLGYLAGDFLIKEVAYRLHSELRDCDTVARINGDEFVVLFENVDDELSAGLIAKRVAKLFEKAFIFKDNEVFLHVNMGISFFPSDGNDTKTLLRNANLAMNKSKSDKTVNFQFFKAQMNEELTNKTLLEANLRRALKNEEFFVEYQPQIDAKNGKIVGAEALVRWTDPDLKSIPPLDFIPIAEDTGLILEIGHIVLKSAINQMKLWHDGGHDDLKIAINISGIQLLQSNLFEQIEELLEDSGLEPRFLDLELTESVLMKNIDRATFLLKAFQRKGIKVSIDDFGTGYSSLNYLKKLPIDIVKIDQSFIKNIQSDKNDKIIVNTIIAMSHALGFLVVAEGVEDNYQCNYLTENKCDFLQGYYFNKPLSAECFEELLENCKNYV